jgi:succinoglycan biosynthesis protein ExoO
VQTRNIKRAGIEIMRAASSTDFVARCASREPAGGEATVDATIVIPTYQAVATLPRAIQSALDQTLGDIEIIVADDCSTDGTWPLVSEWLAREKRLRAFRNPRNRGKSATMNQAVSLARGRWLAVLDADDWYHPERLAALVAIGERRNVAMVADNQLLYDAAADTVVGNGWPAGGADWRLGFDDYLVGAEVYDAFNLGMLKPVVRTEFVRATRLAYDERARFGEDFLYLLEFFLAGGNAAVADTPYYFYTQPFGSVSHRWSHGRRRRYDFQAACELIQSHIQAADGRISPSQTRYLTRRCRRLAALENYFRAREALARGDWRRCVAWLVADRAMFDYGFYRLFGRYFSSAAARVANQSQRRAGGAREASLRMRFAADAKN